MDIIYVERDIENHPRTKEILGKFSNSHLIMIESYGEVFNKRNQSFRIQKKNPALILAKKHFNFVLPTPKGFGMRGYKNFYFSHMFNCIYDCQYCFLQGMYSSANYVIFVNFEDFGNKICEEILLSGKQKLSFFSGYDCDSLALEGITGFVDFILPLFKNHPNALLELRTKSIQINPLMSTEPIANCVVAYSLLPCSIAQSLDTKTPSVKNRINTMSQLAARGWKIGLRLDPLIHDKNWEYKYRELIHQIFSSVPSQSIHSISYGSLRFPKKMFKNILKQHPKARLFSTKLADNGELVKYDSNLENEMIDFCKKITSNFVAEEINISCSS